LQQIDFGSGEPILADEWTGSWRGLPRRHVPALCDVSDLARMQTRAAVRKNAERRGSSWMMAARAVLENDRGHIFRERDRRGWRRLGRCVRCRASIARIQRTDEDLHVLSVTFYPR
jgi:hypothetical protein